MYNPINQTDLEVIQADVAAGDLLFDKARTSNNPNFRCIAAYHYAQAIEKSLRAIVRVDCPSVYEARDRNGVRYIEKTHDISVLLDEADACRPGTIRSNRFIHENDSKLANFNNLRFGGASISLPELGNLQYAARGMMYRFEKDFLAAYPDEKANEKASQEEWIKRLEADLRIPKVYKPLVGSISGAAISQKDYDMLSAAVESADILFQASKTSKNRNMICLAGFHYGEIVSRALKAIIETDRPELYKMTYKDGSPMFKNTHDVCKLLTYAELCRNGLISRYIYIAENSEAIQSVSRLRYGKRSTTHADIKSLATVVKSLAGELMRDFEAQNPDPVKNAEETAREWAARDKTALRNPNYTPRSTRTFSPEGSTFRNTVRINKMQGR